MYIKTDDDTTSDALRQIEIALVVDTTGSMGGEIAAVRRELRRLVDAVVAHPLRPRLRVAAVGYRDHSPQESSYVARVFSPFEEDPRRIGAAIAAMAADGGGDGPEAVVDGVAAALKLRWTRPAQKAVILVGDAPPHGVGAPGDAFPGGCPCGTSLHLLSKELRAAGITAHAIGVRSDPIATRTFAEFAKGTGGDFLPLAASSDLVRLLVDRAAAELGKVAEDLRTIDKLRRGEPLDVSGRASLERLAGKGVRVAGPPARPGDPRLPRIRVVRRDGRG